MIRDNEVICVRGTTVVEVCSSNAVCGQRLFDLEEEFPFVSVIETECMSECETCAQMCYVFLDGDMVLAESPDQLVDTIRARLTGNNP